jgi:hypothetical protein
MFLQEALCGVSQPQQHQVVTGSDGGGTDQHGKSAGATRTAHVLHAFVSVANATSEQATK